MDYFLRGDLRGETALRVIVARRSISGNFRYSPGIGRSFPCRPVAKKIHVATHTIFPIGAQFDTHLRTWRTRRDEFFFLDRVARRLFPWPLQRDISLAATYRAGILPWRHVNST